MLLHALFSFTDMVYECRYRITERTMWIADDLGHPLKVNVSILNIDLHILSAVLAFYMAIHVAFY